MAAYIFQTIANKGAAAGITPNKTAEAREWYRSAAGSLISRNVNKNKIMADKKNVIGQITGNSIGQMFMFFYDPKHKDILPHYDIFPLVFPIEMYKDGFLGINLHYLPPMARAGLMDSLYNTANNDKYDDTTKLQISYRILSSASAFSAFAPCLKRYLYSHVQSGYLYVDPSNWDSAIMLPTERFQKQRKAEVFQHSRKRI
jgi:hypothetical protein